MSTKFNMSSPAAKGEVVGSIVETIRQWEDPVMVHESLRKLSRIARVPEDIVGVGNMPPRSYASRNGNVGLTKVDADRIIEADLLRWLVLVGETKPAVVSMTLANITPDDIRIPFCRALFKTYLEKFKHNEPRDMLSLAISVDDAETQSFLSEITKKKVNIERAEQHAAEVVKKILDRNWMEKREQVRMRINSGACSEEEVMALVKEFDELKKHPPVVAKA